MSAYDVFIGLEIHIHLLCASKQFCGCRAQFGGEPNAHTCPVCLGYPGVLPAANEESMKMAFLVARALECELSKKCFFDRKNYFYPDMTKNYQISQFHDPVGRNGRFDIEVDGAVRTIRIHDVHLEEDAGKMIHQGRCSLLDYNRAGSPLLEIVTEPDLRSAVEAEAFIREFRRLVRHLGVCDGNMEEGSLRCDANVSINHPGAGLGTKTEVKNVNSARFVRKALEFEIRRQARLLDKGERVIQETRLWDADKGATAGMRTKEKAHDYRYFPEPDMPPFVPDEPFLAEVASRMVERPLQRKQRYVATLDIAPDTADFLVEELDAGRLFEALLTGNIAPKTAANWIAGDVQAQLKRADTALQGSHITPERLSGLIAMVEEGRLPRGKAKEVLELVIARDEDPVAIVAEMGWEQVLDDGELDGWVVQVIAANPDVVQKVKGGDGKPLAFLMGQIMKMSKGKADPKRAREKLEQAIAG